MVALAAAAPPAVMAQGDPFALAPVPTPRGDLTLRRLADWVQLTAVHQAGQEDAPATRALSLSANELGGILDSVHRGRLMVLGRDVIPVVERGVLLHTDVAAAQMVEARLPDRASTGGLAYLHFGMATELVKVLRSRPATEPFVHAWYVAVAAILASHREVNQAPDFLDRALRDFPSDPRLLLLAGAARELRASPRVQEATDLGSTLARVGSVKDNLRRAEDFYRRAVSAAPLQVEARVRLGRVLGLTGRPAEALTELESAGREAAAASEHGAAADPQVLYFLSLFTGEQEEALNRLDAARASYARALALYPLAGAPLLDLGRLELRNGSWDAAVDAVSRLARPAPAADRDDPWQKYACAGPARHVPETLVALGAAIGSLK